MNQDSVCRITATDFLGWNDRTQKHENNDYYGTGFRWGGPWVMTNSHVAGDTQTLATAQFEWTTQTPNPFVVSPTARIGFIVELRSTDNSSSVNDIDLALIHVPELEIDCSVPGVADKSRSTVEDNWKGVCYHHEHGQGLKEQKVEGFKNMFTPPIDGGSSGAPVFSSEQFIGVNFCGTDTKNFLVLGNIVNSFAEQSRVLIPSVSILLQLVAMPINTNLQDRIHEEACSIAQMVSGFQYNGAPLTVLLSCPNSTARQALRNAGVKLA